MHIAAVLTLAALALAGAATAQSPAPAVIEAGAEVALQYVLKDDTGNLVDSNHDEAPLRFTVGSTAIIRGLQAAVTGMRAGETKRFTLQPGEAYGHADPAAIAEIARERLPADGLQEGAYVVAQNPGSPARLVRVKEVRARTVVVDLNHPLAGKVLHFEVKILEVTPPRKPR